MIYTYVYTHIYTLVNALKNTFRVLFLCQSRRGIPGEWDENRETSERKYIREREKRSRKTKERNMNMSCHKLKESNKQGTQALFNIQIN